MALALQEQLNMEDSGGNAAAMAYQAGQPMAVAPAAMIGRLTGTLLNDVSRQLVLPTWQEGVTRIRVCALFMLILYDKLMLMYFHISQLLLLRPNWPRIMASPEWTHTAASASATLSTKRRRVQTARRSPSGTRPLLATSIRYVANQN